MSKFVTRKKDTKKPLTLESTGINGFSAWYTITGSNRGHPD